ncbi:FAD-dependent oxidoreductase [Actinomycetospora endophytica]|uniref:FAD-dependent oxidoreductase n=1 Tax=Actinomycetospora endophytica TaxID=2291215 RepID=A0ABS8P0M8_9PSEU|nr:FAD-dependent oxidoreductase [Actinomycetospora endophytica]MCD2191800.1 FAD-dependent oxidoreductase [Actinomycetospora endophytica]
MVSPGTRVHHGSHEARPPRVVITGSGFAGFHAAKALARRTRGAIEIVVVSPTNYFLYLPLLPEVAGGILEPRRIAVALSDALPACVRHAPGEVDDIDLEAHEIGWLDPEGVGHRMSYDRLILAAGSVHKVMPIPGINQYAVGFRGVPEALYLRDHLVRQIDLAAMCDDPAEREARCTFVVVGAGYTGTEVAAQCQLFTRALAASRGLNPDDMRWVLVSRGEVLAGLNEHLARSADAVLRHRGVEVHTDTTMEEAGDAEVLLSTGERIPTRTLLWCVGVRADPLIENLDIELDSGRVVVHETLQVPGQTDLYACGDVAAVPDPSRPGERTPMTAQHAVRQGALAGRNVAASLGHGSLRPYRHRDLGFVVDLGGFKAAAAPLHLPLTGLPAKIVARSYHLGAMPGNRLRTAVDWTLEALQPRQSAQLGLVRSPAIPLDTASPEVPQHHLGFPHVAGGRQAPDAAATWSRE